MLVLFLPATAAASNAPLLDRIHKEARQTNHLRVAKGHDAIRYKYRPERHPERRAFYLRWWKHQHYLARRLQWPPPTPALAISAVFGAYAGQAIAVAECESGLSIYATNGQYLGLFQMGEYARAVYGHSWTALGQSRAAYRYFVASGRDWSPWECKPT